MSYTSFANVNGDYDMDNGGSTGYQLYIVNAPSSGGNTTFALTATVWQGLTFEIIRKDNNLLRSVTLSANGGNQINGNSSFLVDQKSRVFAIYDGSEWVVTKTGISLL